MLDGDFAIGALKGTLPTQPFVHHNAKCILIARRTRLALNLFWGHVGDGACHVLGALVARTLGDGGDAEVAEQDLVTPPQQHILWLNIAMDELLIVGILQGFGDLLDIADNGGQRQRDAFGMSVAQRAVGGVVHDEERDAILDIEVQHTHNMRVDERCDGLGFAVEVLDVGSLHVEPQVLAEIDLGETSASQETYEAIVAQLLTYTIRHTKPTSFSSILQII